MSRIGKLPINLPSGVELEVEGRDVKVTGPKGTLTLHITRNIQTEVNNGQVIIKNN